MNEDYNSAGPRHSNRGQAGCNLVKRRVIKWVKINPPGLRHYIEVRAGCG